MIVHLITAIAVSVIVILIVWAVFRTLKKPMPGSLYPLLIGITVIAYGIYSEYSWESRTLAQMPDSIEVVHRFEGTSAFSPWAYLIPRTDRLSVVDTSAIRRNPEQPDFALVDLLFMQRFNPVLRVHQIIDCRENRRSDLASDPQFDANGLPVGVQWESLAADHRLLEISCP